jgi:hypothetical protein
VEQEEKRRAMVWLAQGQGQGGRNKEVGEGAGEGVAGELVGEVGEELLRK